MDIPGEAVWVRLKEKGGPLDERVKEVSKGVKVAWEGGTGELEGESLSGSGGGVVRYRWVAGVGRKGTMSCTKGVSWGMRVER